MRTTNTTPTRQIRQRRRPAAATFQAPLMQDPNEPKRPTHHKGVEIAEEQTVNSPLPNGAPFRITRLILADGTEAWGCRDCQHTADTRGKVMAHRNGEHNARYGKRRPRLIPAKDKNVTDIVLPLRGEDPPPSNAMEMTLGEILAIAPSIAALGDLIDRLERECEALREQVAKNQIDRDTQHKIDVYDHHRTEIIDLRLKMQKQANYEDIKAEMYELRAWKNKIKKKLEGVGFVLSEEEQ